jgi:hypothetical protein
VKLLSLILRLVESLDRSHQNVVKHAYFRPSPDKELHLTMCIDGDAQLELWGLRSREKAVRKTLGRHLVLDLVDSDDPDAESRCAPAEDASAPESAHAGAGVQHS